MTVKIIMPESCVKVKAASLDMGDVFLHQGGLHMFRCVTRAPRESISFVAAIDLKDGEMVRISKDANVEVVSIEIKVIRQS